MRGYVLIDKLQRSDVRGESTTVNLYSPRYQGSKYLVEVRISNTKSVDRAWCETWEEAYDIFEEFCKEYDVYGTPATKPNIKPKPQWVQEIESNIGLECVLAKESNWGDEYSVMSPTGVALFKIIGSVETQIIGGVSYPEIYSLQGIDKNERHNRRSKNGPK